MIDCLLAWAKILSVRDWVSAAKSTVKCLGYYDCWERCPGPFFESHLAMMKKAVSQIQIAIHGNHHVEATIKASILSQIPRFLP